MMLARLLRGIFASATGLRDPNAVPSARAASNSGNHEGSGQLPRNTAFPESKVAHKWIDPIEALDGNGVEFGPAAHNPFGFKNCLLADREAPGLDSPYYREQMSVVGRISETHVIAELGTPLPFESHSFDYIVTSHVLEHVWDLIACFDEMRRILRPYGLMVHVVPHVDRTFDRGRPLTTWDQLCARHIAPESNPDRDDHHSVFNTEAFLRVLSNISYLNVIEVLDTDDKVGNGFLVVIQLKHSAAELEPFKGQRPFAGEAASGRSGG